MITEINPEKFRLVTQSKGKEKLQLRKVQSNLDLLKNRVNALKKHQQRQLSSVHKNQEKINQVIQNKIMVSEMNQYKRRGNHADDEQALERKRKNLESKINHEREMSTILKALSIVKHEDAQAVRSASEQHLKKIRQIRQETHGDNTKKQLQVHCQQEKAKFSYLNHVKQRLEDKVALRQKEIEEYRRKKSENLSQIDRLEHEQKELLQNISKIHAQSTQEKKRYYAALKVPAKEVAQALGIGRSAVEVKRERIDSPTHSSKSSKKVPCQISVLSRVPHGYLEQGRLKAAILKLKMGRKTEKTL